jgi:hypothetical protein
LPKRRIKLCLKKDLILKEKKTKKFLKKLLEILKFLICLILAKITREVLGYNEK